MYPRIWSRCINWAKSQGSCSVEFEEQGDKMRVCLRTWDIDIFRKVCVATLVRYSSDPIRENSALGRIVHELGPDASVVPISGGSSIHVEAFSGYLGSGYRQRLIDYPSFDLRSFKRCLLGTTSSEFGSLDGLALTEFIVNRLKSAQKRDWMSSHFALRKAILTNDLGMLHLVDLVANILGLWPLIVPYLKETGGKADGESPAVESCSFQSCWCIFIPAFFISVMFIRKELTVTPTWIKWRG